MKSIIAAFDFDGTLTRRDTLFLFLRHVSGSSSRYYAGMTLSLPLLTAYALRIIPNHEAKRRLLSRFLKGMTRETLQRHCETFSPVIDRNLRASALATIARHRSQGNKIIIVSASLRCWIEPWARLNGVDQVIATEIEFSTEDTVTGHFSTPNCNGEEKANRLRRLLTPRDSFYLTAYGDSRRDLPMLRMADEAHYRELS